MRLFVAVYPPEPVCADLGAVVDTLAVGRAADSGVNARLAPRANWHLTLVFLGDVPDRRCADVALALSAGVEHWKATARATAASPPPTPRPPPAPPTPPGPPAPPTLWIGGGGRFGRGRFTILWAGVHGDIGPLRALDKQVRRQLRRARLPYDDKPLKPHLTLARPGDRVDVVDDIAALDTYRGPEWTVTGLCLVRSHPGPRPTYDRMADIPLA